MSDLVEEMKRRHDAAREVYKAFEEDGQPFVLYLRDYGYERLVGPKDGDMQPLYNTIAESLPGECGLILVQNQKFPYLEGMKSRYRTDPRVAPGLVFEDENWQDGAAWLISHASLIICQLSFLKPGTEWEISYVLHAKQQHKTVLVLPGLSETELTPLDGHPLLMQFVRCMYYGEAGLEGGPLAHFSMAELVQRASGIAAAKSARSDTGNEAPDQCVPPIYYDGVAGRYCSLAYHFDVDFNPEAKKFSEEDELARARHIAFWSYYRGASVYEFQVARGSEEMTPERFFELLVCYTRIAEMAWSESKQPFLPDRMEQIALGKRAVMAAEGIEPFTNLRFADNRLEKLKERYQGLFVI